MCIMVVPIAASRSFLLYCELIHMRHTIFQLTMDSVNFTLVGCLNT